MKKLPFFLPIGITLIALILIKADYANSQNVKLPYPNAEKAPIDYVSNPSICIQNAANEIEKMRNAWFSQMDLIDGQGKPASESVDDYFESMRTYRCWLDYLCEGVKISALAGKNDIIKMGGIKGSDAERLKNGFKTMITPLSGCVSPSAIEIPGTELRYIPQCYINSLSGVVAYYEECKKLVQDEFSDTAASSPAYTMMERKVMALSGRQKGRALAEKIGSINDKLYLMNAFVDDLRVKIYKFDSLVPCFISKCD